MDIADWRKKIDEIDARLVSLLNERAACTVEIGKIKRRNGMPILEANREEEVMRHVQEANHGPLSDEALRRLFEAIVREGRHSQQNLTADQPSDLEK